MATITWNSGVSGDFEDSSKWTGGTAPGVSDNAVISASGTYTVTALAGDTVTALTIGSGVTFVDTAGFTVSGGTLSNAGTLDVSSGAALYSGNDVVNSGTITLNGTTSTASDIYIGDYETTVADTIFSGGGHITLNDSAIYTNTVVTYQTLENVNDTIAGSGTIGGSGFDLDNQASGVILANQTDALLINTGVVLQNEGTIEATGSGGLSISTVDVINSGIISSSGVSALSISASTLLTNSGTIHFGSSGAGTLADTAIDNTGTISETGGGTLTISSATLMNTGSIIASGAGSVIAFGGGATMVGGTLTTTSGGVIEASSAAYFDGSQTAGEVTLNGTFDVLNGDTAYFAGILNNTGTINVAGIGIGYGAFCFGFAGMSGTTNTLTGGGHMVLNDGYVVTGTSDLSQSVINVNNTISGSGNFGNNGFTFDNQAAGKILANQSTLLTVATLTLTNEGTMLSTGTGGLTIDDDGILTNTGTISASGTGGLSITFGASPYVWGTTLTNDGTISVTGTGASFIIGNEPGNVAVNNGTISETGGGTLTIQNATYTNTGSFVVSGTGSVLAFSGSDVIGGTLTSSAGGVFETAPTAYFDGSQTAGEVTLNGTFDVLNGDTAYFAGILNNTGTINVAGIGIGYGAFCFGFAGMSGTTNTLTGGGHMVLNDGYVVTGTSDLSQSVINVNNTISGSGNFGNNGFTFDNQAAGKILANQSTLLTVATLTLTNEGTMLSTGAGGLTIDDDGILTNTGTISASGTGGLSITFGASPYVWGTTLTNDGTISVTGTGASFIIGNEPGNVAVNNGTISETGGGTLTIQNATYTNTGSFVVSGTGSVLAFSGSDVIGGTLTSSAGGVFETAPTAYFDGSQTAGEVTLNGTFDVLNGDTAYFAGILNNTGTINVTGIGGGYGAFGFGFDGMSGSTDTLTGGGHMVLNNGYVITGTPDITQSVINVNNTITGSGNFGGGGFNFDNQTGGVINANTSTALAVDVLSLSNEGLLEATGSGGMTIEGGSSITNTGTIAAVGGNVTIDSAVTGTGNATVGDYSTLEFTSTATTNTSFISGNVGILKLDNSAGFTGTIRNFDGPDVLDLTDLSFVSGSSSAILNSTTNVLTVTNGSTSVSYQLVSPVITSFHVVADATGGTYVVGTDTLIGTTGNDNLTVSATSVYTTVIGLGGNDTININKTGVHVYEPTTGTDTVKASVSYTLDPNITNLTLAPGTTNINGTGNTKNNTITGNLGNNVLDGGGGSDTLIGGGGNDTYDYNSGYGADKITNGSTGSNVAASTLDFGSGLVNNAMWFDEVNSSGVVSSTGANLRIDILGTNQSVTLVNWFASGDTYAQLADITDGSGNSITSTDIASNVSNLVSAMASFEASYLSTYGTAFNPAAAANAGAITGNSTLVAAVNSNWH